jgi:hypothetical protein
MSEVYTMHKWLLIAVCPLMMLGCWVDPPAVPPMTTQGAKDGQQFHAKLMEVGRDHQSYGRVNTVLMRWAPTFCRAPTPDTPAGPLYSKSDDAETHGRKLYSLFVKIKPQGIGTSYVGKPDSPVGQVIVKETWLPEPITDVKVTVTPGSKTSTLTAKRADGSALNEEIKDNFLPYAQKGDTMYYAAKKGPLFVMMKLDPKTPDTDNGWIYGAMSSDGQEILEVGRIESCMKCHKDAPHDRLFGLAKE